MENVVYADLYFLINFSMDFLCFFLSGKLVSKALSPLRMALASALGGIYAIALLLIILPQIWLIILHIFVCALMCLIAMTDKKTLGELPFYTLVFTAISMFLGGVMTALMSLFDKLFPKDTILSDSAEGASDSISVYALAALAVIGAIITLAGSNSLKGRMARRNAMIVVEINNNSTSFSGISDTGNLLQEPISGKPCIVVAPDVLKDILPYELIKMIKSGASADTILCKYKNPLSHPLPLRLIPAKTATGESMLLGFIPDKLYIDTGKGNKRVDAGIAIGIIEKSSHGINALIPAELMI
ncbi:MAG: sigma-E processing peptidase SpoIIGA [Clostridia bacterium]|nr:sigma-E processing peptidase SpoIIGA [Clostridia bacterium]